MEYRNEYRQTGKQESKGFLCRKEEKKKLQ